MHGTTNKTKQQITKSDKSTILLTQSPISKTKTEVCMGIIPFKSERGYGVE